ncbi:hypothetical protein DPMN_126054 [Dreissena polymorpha]|uniref:Uncharacterized protein n=1 Tax=Dreissena polymorpha TaxID=45954 RepID=A0A9D4JXS2_DREPO|nr:hypothetical protein DPMN_126054 [Dreissena polymorpha]
MNDHMLCTSIFNIQFIRKFLCDIRSLSTFIEQDICFNNTVVRTYFANGGLQENIRSCLCGKMQNRLSRSAALEWRGIRIQGGSRITLFTDGGMMFSLTVSKSVVGFTQCYLV